MIHIETERLILRNVHPGDDEIMFDYRNNEICARYQRDQTKDREGIAELVRKRANDTLSVSNNSMVAVALKESDEMVGEIVVMPNDGTIYMGYTFSYRHHRRGYAFEALTALTERLHSDYPDQEFVCFTEPENAPSRALLQKLGYTDLGFFDKLESQVYGKYTKPGSW